MRPSTTRFCPATNEDASEARKSNGPSSSLKSPHRPAGVRVSSHAVKEIYQFGGAVHEMVPPGVYRRLRERFPLPRNITP